MRTTAPTAYTAGPIGVTNSIGHVRRNLAGHLRRTIGHVGPEYSHDYMLNGTTTLFAALNVLDGQVIAQCQKRHRHIEWLNSSGRLSAKRPRTRCCT